MGISILEQVLQRLRDVDFIAEAGYPGQKYPKITAPVAAVHIEKVERSNHSVTMGIHIVCPSEMGGAQAELEALRATEALRWAGAVCVQQGCSYDGAAQVYVVPVEATFTGIAAEDSFAGGPGFTVYIGGSRKPYAVSFQAEQEYIREYFYEIGEDEPAGMTKDSKSWKIRLEELIPSGSLETVTDPEEFELKVDSGIKTEVYSGCCWNHIQWEHTREGMRRIRTGTAALREEANE